MAEIERADLQQAQFSHPAGTSGVAYAGGIASNGVLHLQQLSASVPAKDPTVERIKANDRGSPKDDNSAQAAKRLSRDKDREVQVSRESPKTRERAQTVSSVSSYTDAHTSMTRTPEYRGSPQFVTPLASPGERSAGYTQYIPDSYRSADSQMPPRPASRKGAPIQTSGSPDSNLTRQTPPAATGRGQLRPTRPHRRACRPRSAPPSP